MTIIRSEIQGKKILVTFPYTESTVFKIKTVPGAKFVTPEKGGPAWSFPLEFRTCQVLSETFGRMIIFGPELIEWGKAEATSRRNLLSLAISDTAELTRVQKKEIDLYCAVHVGPRGRDMTDEEYCAALEGPGSYQAADALFMSNCRAPLNANQPGLGKTITSIASVYEADLEMGPKLVIAPISSLETVWATELTKWQSQPVFVVSGSRQERAWAISDALACDEPYWMICNAQMLQMRRGIYPFPEIMEMEWSVVILDEAHKTGVQTPGSATAEALGKLKAKKRMALTGTPVGGIPIKLWGILNWLDPHAFPSKWRWAEQWLEVQEEEIYVKGQHVGPDGEIVQNTKKTRKIGKIRPGLELDFYKSISAYVVRRTKAEVAPQLPPKQHVRRLAEMGPAQAKQYKSMAEDAEARISADESITATGILAEYTRLKQIAFSTCTLGKIINEELGTRQVLPTEDSCKLPILLEYLIERNVWDPEDKDAPTGEQAIVFSQFSKVLDVADRFLAAQGIRTVKITGDVTKKGARAAIQRKFQSQDDDRPQVILMTTTAGGVAITLDNASTVVFLDETWNPDDQEQAEDRAHRVSRIHNVEVCRIMTKGTIEFYIDRVLKDKTQVNSSILDLHRMGLRADRGIE